MSGSNKQPSAQLAQEIEIDRHIIFCGNDFYIYNKDIGFYKKWHDQEIFKLVKNTIGFEYSVHKIDEVIRCLQADCFKDPDFIVNHSYLNLKNGLLDINTFELRAHTHKVVLTTQLQIKFEPRAACPKWLKSLDEIFEGDQKKVELLQEYSGLCLTPETKFAKALFMLGEGGNGKSVVLEVLQQLLGRESFSAIPLEKFNCGHYMANIFGKLANISIETNAKSSVYDATFKAVVTGDVITADAKFKPPITFRPYCKLIFALNNMPRVDDKTLAFYRRILILKFNRVFQEKEQNKNLKFELLEELDGIFYWSLQGLKRLRERGHFETTNEMIREIEEYRKENNNVLVFVDEMCRVGAENTFPKDELYCNYAAWCKGHGNSPLSMIRFGKELKKQFPDLDEERSSLVRCWRGIKYDKFVTG